MNQYYCRLKYSVRNAEDTSYLVLSFMNKYNFLNFCNLNIETPSFQAACLQDSVHQPLDVGHDLGDRGKLGTVAGHQLPTALELLSFRPMSLLLRKSCRLIINQAIKL